MQAVVVEDPAAILRADGAMMITIQGTGEEDPALLMVGGRGTRNIRTRPRDAGSAPYQETAVDILDKCGIV